MKGRIIGINWHSISVEERRAMWPSEQSTRIQVAEVLVLYFQVGSWVTFDKWPYLYMPQFSHLYNGNNNAHFFCEVFWYILIHKELYLKGQFALFCLVKRRDVARKLQEFLTSHNKVNANAAGDEQEQCYHSTFEVNVCIRTPCFICFYPYCESIGVFIYCKLKACHKGGG